LAEDIFEAMVANAERGPVAADGAL
jgi:hypothetical protein